jgi:hypothetical protein
MEAAASSSFGMSAPDFFFERNQSTGQSLFFRELPKRLQWDGNGALAAAAKRDRSLHELSSHSGRSISSPTRVIFELLSFDLQFRQ